MIDFKRDYDKVKNHKGIYKHKENGTYAVQFYLNDEIYNTRKKDRTSGFNTIRDAQDYMANQRVKNKNQENRLSKDMIFAKAYVDYINACKLDVKKGHLDKNTLAGKETIFKNQILPKLSNVIISQMTEEHILKFQNDLLSMKNSVTNEPLANETIRKVHKQLSAFLNYCVSKKLLLYNPAGRVGNFKRVKKKKVYLTKDEFKDLISKIDNIRDYFIIILLFHTGLRIGEVLGLTKDNIVTTINEDGTSQTLLTIDKTYCKNEIRYKAKTEGSLREIYLDDKLVEVYNIYLEHLETKNINSDFLFCNNRGICEVIGDRAIRDMIKKYVKLAGINKKITPHKFRHSHAVFLISNGGLLEDVKHRLGHQDIRTTSNEYGDMYAERKINIARELSANLQNVYDL